MELDGDEEDIDEEMEGMPTTDDVEDDEETKAKVEKMKLGGVDDVRSVAVLMKKLDPILEVSNLPFSPLNLRRPKVYICFIVLDLTSSRLCRKSHIFNRSHLRSGRLMAPSKMTPSTSY
jgi:hypothetical protein